MYLKSLEMNGFKSFPRKTRLDFEPGLTAVVGPNGCGKSNVSDAIRWVLGEQSPKAMRGSKMEDCIFNGTDARKPMGMAEVSVTFSDCENVLDTEFNEVTITRRVFRSGEGQYMINKTPCRLKDIQRLFMDTGIGTSSYSFMEQGRIDRILSSRPEDRRAVFEEASGITKFKSDKKEAIRKLEHTEANLLRLADVIREVKRQIGSLQRQAGKARRYKAMREELRALDIRATRERLKAADRDIARQEAELSGLAEAIAKAQTETAEIEQGNTVLREGLMQTERAISQALEAEMQAKGQLEHTHEMIRVNQQRIDELRSFSERDEKLAEATRRRMASEGKLLEQLDADVASAGQDHEKVEAELKRTTDQFVLHQETTDGVRREVQKLREESVELESLASRLQNQLVELDARERGTVVQRERLSAEKAQLARTAESFERRQREVEATLGEMNREVEAAREAVHALEQARAEAVRALGEARRQHGEAHSHTAAARARVDLLSDGDTDEEGFPAGSRLVLDASNPLDLEPGTVLGALADHVRAEPGFEKALEACLRAWLDAVLVCDPPAALATLRAVAERNEGSARLLSVESPALWNAPADSAGAAGERLVDHIVCDAHVRTVLERLLGHIRIVDDLARADLSVPGAGYVTRDGRLWQPHGSAELWTGDKTAANPLSRKHELLQARQVLRDAESRQASLAGADADRSADVDRIDGELRAARETLAERSRAAAQKEGELQLVSRETAEARDRAETVTWELENLNSQDASTEEEKQALADRLRQATAQRRDVAERIRTRGEDLRGLESRHAELQAAVTDQRVHFAGVSQRVEHLRHRRDALQARLDEWTASLDGRTADIEGYAESIARLTRAIEDSRGRLQSLEEAVTANTGKADSLRRNRTRQAEELKAMETDLTNKRAAIEDLRGNKSGLDIRLTEARMRRQNQAERITGEYNITLDVVMAEPPEAEREPVALDEVETAVAELRTKLEAMGPVNLVAIEEHQELEERYGFLTEQEQDLVRSKQQLMDMIRRINRTTTEMFSKTFEQVNSNFQDMFARLFKGGTAKLVLVNEEDVLECGIEIIARPPGKRLQNVSLLSGGERTLTAVALLFAIYMIKPSPFCLLDELDAALDDSNIGRFVKILEGFLAQSQFLVITHNRQTIAAADILYGITMQERGVSKTVSMRFGGREQEAEELKVEG